MGTKQTPSAPAPAFLTADERKKWLSGGWTTDGALAVDVATLAADLGVPVGRAATIRALCKAGPAAADDVQRAIDGDADARRVVSQRTHGLPWVALRNAKPDLDVTRALVAELADRPARRSMYKGLLVIDVSDLGTASAKLPRCPISGRVLDDHEGKLVDGETGADWAPTWPDRGNGRALWLAHLRTAGEPGLPPYALADSARVASELSAVAVPVQWQRAQQAWQRATEVEKATAQERLYRAADPTPAPNVYPPNINGQCEATRPGYGCPGTRGACARPGSVGRCGLMVGGVQQAMRTSLRSMLERMDDSSLCAFVLDNFPAVYRRFGSGMDKVAKVNLLLTIADAAEVQSALSR